MTKTARATMVTFDDIFAKRTAVAVIGLGYVGLPLAVALGKKVRVIGFDISPQRIEMLRQHLDPSRELSAKELKAATIEYTADAARLREAQFIVVAVPTPIDPAKNPDLTLVRKDCDAIGKNLTPGSVVVFESTVYPGVTDEVCGPAIEKASGLTRGKDFTLGYSPERINPGDREHTLATVVKIVSGEDGETLDLVAAVYGLVVEAGVHRASSLKVAEAAKVIENTQRDLNIALMNELSVIFNRIGIDTREVLDAAGTKWNFLRFSPGLVGGQCIGVDPYYLTHKAKEIGYNAEVILAGRRINDSMGKYVAETTVKLLIHNGIPIKWSKVLILGLAFKENVSDIRNTRVVDIISELQSFGIEVIVCDPYADPADARREYAIELQELSSAPKVDAVVIGAAHAQFKALTPGEIQGFHREKQKAILVDIRRIFSRGEFEKRGITYWGL